MTLFYADIPHPVKMYYFGPIREPGHYYWSSDNSRDYSNKAETNPWGWPWIAGYSLAPKTKDYEGQCIAAIHHKDGWTAMSFWDRSVDKRHKSSSTFLAEGTFNFKQMLDGAKIHFPKRVEVCLFPLVEYVP